MGRSLLYGTFLELGRTVILGALLYYTYAIIVFEQTPAQMLVNLLPSAQGIAALKLKNPLVEHCISLFMGFAGCLAIKVLKF